MKKFILTILLILCFAIAGCNMDTDGTWKGGHIGYYFEGDWTDKEVTNLRAAMDEWEACGSSIHFVKTKLKKHGIKRRGYKLKIKHSNDGSNSATVGAVTCAVLNLSKDAPMSILRHELGHVIGLIHEHQRPDRDVYIIIHWENIIPEKTSNFTLKPLSRVFYNIWWIHYDFASIMQYHPWGFSKNGKPTITKLNGSTSWPYQEEIQESDCLKVIDIY